MANPPSTGYPAPARRSPLRVPLTMLVLVTTLVLSAWYGWRALVGADEPDGDVALPAGCTRTAYPDGTWDLLPSDITVNVYNATRSAGLAGRTATELRSRGFKIGRVENDPLNKKVTIVAEIRSAPDAQPQAVLLQRQLLPGSSWGHDDRQDYSVDLVLGDTFTELAPRVDSTTRTTVPPPGC